MPPDYYHRLGVPPDASMEQIKSAYRKQCLHHHPDSSGRSGHEEFLRISEAYQTLIDPVQRAQYDQRLRRARPHAPSAGYAHQRSPRPPIEDVHPHHSRRHQNHGRGGRVLEVELTLTPQEAAKGGRIAIEVPIPTACSSCGGHGELAWRVCPRCGGRGIVQAVCTVGVVIPRHLRDRLVIPAPISNGFVQLRVHVRIRE